MFSYPRLSWKFQYPLPSFLYFFDSFSKFFFPIFTLHLHPTFTFSTLLYSYSPTNRSSRAKNGGSYLFGFYTLVLFFSFTLLFLPFPFHYFSLHCSLFFSWAHYFCSCLNDVSTLIRQSIHLGTTIFLHNFLRTGHYFLGGICRVVKPVGRNVSFLSPLMVKSVFTC